MTSQNLENLVKTGNLKSEPASQGEFNGLLRSAKDTTSLLQKKVEAMTVVR